MNLTTFSEPSDACNHVASARSHVRQSRCLLLSLLADATQNADPVQINLLLAMNLELRGAAQELDALTVWVAAV